jgi:hypothetical protein
MNNFMDLVLSAYVAFFLLDLGRSWQQYSNHKFLSFDKPTKKLHQFFIENHWSSVITWVVIYILGLLFL